MGFEGREGTIVVVNGKWFYRLPNDSLRFGPFNSASEAAIALRGRGKDVAPLGDSTENKEHPSEYAEDSAAKEFVMRVKSGATVKWMTVTATDPEAAKAVAEKQGHQVYGEPKLKRFTTDVAPVGDADGFKEGERVFVNTTHGGGTGLIRAVKSSGAYLVRHMGTNKELPASDLSRTQFQAKDAGPLGQPTGLSPKYAEISVLARELDITNAAAEKLYNKGKRPKDKAHVEQLTYKPSRAKDAEVKPVKYTPAPAEPTVSPQVAKLAHEAALRQIKAGERMRGGKDAEVKPIKYNAEAVQKEINKDKRIGGKEAKAIHALLKGRTGDSAEQKLQKRLAQVKDKQHLLNNILKLFVAYPPKTAEDKALYEAAKKQNAAFKAIDSENKALAPIAKVIPRSQRPKAEDAGTWTVTIRNAYYLSQKKYVTVTASSKEEAKKKAEPERAKLGWEWHIIRAVPSGSATDASPFERDTDYGSAMLIIREAEAGKKPAAIAKETGFDLRFVNDVLNGKYGKSKSALKKALAKDVAPVGAHVGMMGVNADKAKALAKSLERNGFEYRFPVDPPTEQMVSHGFVRRNEGGKNEWRVLNERKNGFHNITGGNLARAKDVAPVGDASMINVSYKLNGPTAFQVNTSQFVEWARKNKKEIGNFVTRLKALQEFTGDPRIKDWETD